jgi:hypothetical protein
MQFTSRNRRLDPWLMLTRLVFGSTGSMANSEHLVGALVITFSIIALAWVCCHEIWPLDRHGMLSDRSGLFDSGFPATMRQLVKHRQHQQREEGR